MEVKNYIGTSGLSYEHWKGVFYPEDLKLKDFLSFYTRYFDTVEMNNTFYHTPRDTSIEKWMSETSQNFVFSIKASRFITHIKRLKDVEDSLELFLQKAELFGDKLGAILFQLPPSLRADVSLLRDFLLLLPKEKHFTIEFRHKSWLSDEVFTLLSDYNIAFCISDTPRYPYAEVVTADFSYIRLHGHEVLYASSYSDEQLNHYAKFIKKWNKKGIEFFVYFDNDFYGYAVKNALKLKEILRRL